MNQSAYATLSRRRLLQGAGSAAFALPFVRHAVAAAAEPRPRLVLLMQSNGTSQANFWPEDGFQPSPILRPILGHEALRRKTTVLRGITNTAGGPGNGHDWGFAGLWSGTRPVGTGFDPWGNAISVDQILKNRLGFTEPHSTLNCGVLASNYPTFKSHRRSFSYLGPLRQVPTQTDPFRLYATYFAQRFGDALPAAEAAALEVRLRQQRSVLDYVSADLQALGRRLAGTERAKLDAHLGAVRAFERRLGATVSPAPDDPRRCAAIRAPAGRLDLQDEANVPELVRLMFDFVVAALACNLTRIVTFQFGSGGEKWHFGWLGINENSHDEIAHRDYGDPVVTDKIVRMNVWYAEQVAMLANALDAVPEGGGTLLDSTLLVWGNEIATGPHSMENIPIVLLGSAAGRLKRTGFTLDEGPQTYHRLGTSVLRIMGVPADGLGEEPTCGPVAGLPIA